MDPDQLHQRLQLLQASGNYTFQQSEIAALAEDVQLPNCALIAHINSPDSYIAALTILRLRAQQFSQQDVYQLLSATEPLSASFAGRVAGVWAKNDAGRVYELSQIIGQICDARVQTALWLQFCEAFPSRRNLVRVNWAFAAEAGNPSLFLRLLGDVYEFRRPENSADFQIFVHCFCFLEDECTCSLTEPVVCRAIESVNVNTPSGAPYMYFRSYCSYFNQDRLSQLSYRCLIKYLSCLERMTHECAEYLQCDEVQYIHYIVNTFGSVHDSPSVFMHASKLICLTAESACANNIPFDLESYALRARLFLNRDNLPALFQPKYDPQFLNQAEYYLVADGVLDDTLQKQQFPGLLKASIQSALYTLSSLPDNRTIAIQLSRQLLLDGWYSYFETKQAKLPFLAATYQIISSFVQNIKPDDIYEQLRDILLISDVAAYPPEILQLHINYLKEINRFGGSKNRSFVKSLVEFLTNCVILNTSSEAQQIALFALQKLISQGALGFVFSICSQLEACDSVGDAQRLCDALCSQQLPENGLLRDAIVLQIKQQFKLCSSKEQIQYLCENFKAQCKISSSQDIEALVIDSGSSEQRKIFRKFITSLQMCVSLLNTDEEAQTVDDIAQMQGIQTFIARSFQYFADSSLTDFRVSLQQIVNNSHVIDIPQVNDEPVYRKINFCNDILIQLLAIGVRIGIGERLQQQLLKYPHIPPQIAIKLGVAISNDAPYFSQDILQQIFDLFVTSADSIQVEFIQQLNDEQQDVIKYHLSSELNKCIIKFQDCVDKISPDSVFRYLTFCAKNQFQHTKVMSKVTSNYKDYAGCLDLLQFAFSHGEFQFVANVVDDCIKQNDIATAQMILQANDQEMQYLVTTARSISPGDLQYVLQEISANRENNH